MYKIRLGVNIDHVATIRNARGGVHPDPVNAAIIAEKAGADGITAHLREDRRHISDADIERLKASINLPLNLEMAATEEMLQIALRTKPNAACIVPEKRQEVTTEGGLDLTKNYEMLEKCVKQLKEKSIRISLFLEADKKMIDLAHKLEVDIIEFHTGKYCHLAKDKRSEEFLRIKDACEYATSLGIECHAGHGLDFETAAEISKIKEIKELNIGHFLIGESIYSGLEFVIKKMIDVISK